MSTEKILDRASFLKGVAVGRTLWRLAGGPAGPAPEVGPFQMKIDLQPYGRTLFNADMRGTFHIDWGDGSSESVDYNGSNGLEHEYPALGVYTITIEGDLRLLGHGPWARNALKAVVELLSPLPASLETISYAFSECGGLTAIPPDLFSRCAGLKSLTGCFSKSPIAAIPAGLFDNCAAAVSFDSCFANCTALTAIPAGLFDRCAKAAAFDNCFLGCALIAAIPAGLFGNCPEAKSFSSCFHECAALVDIPGGLFRGLRKATTFSSCFGWCGALASVPDDLFDGCAAAVYFDSCFQMCTSLGAVGSGLFADSPLAARFRACFSSCSSLTSVPDSLFDGNAVTQLNECFLRCTKLAHAPALWTKFPNATHTRCFLSCKMADNYEDIPTDWK